MMNYIIVDDNKMARKLLLEMASQFDHLKLIAECENPIEAINIMKKEIVDLILLDIEMPKMTGLQFLKSIDNHPLVILITAKSNYAVEAFEYNIVDYLVTPVSEDRFIKAINKASGIFESIHEPSNVPDKEFIFIRDKGILTKIKTADIIYLQALGDYVTIHTFEKKYTVRMTIGAASLKLSSEKFIRIHRSYIVAVDKVDFVEENTASVHKYLIPIGDMYRSDLVKKLNIF